MQNRAGELPGGPDRQQNLQIGPGRSAGGEMTGKSLHRRGLEQAADRELDLQHGANAADQPDGQQRVPAEIEEVVVDAEPLHAQHLGEQRAEDPLVRGARRTTHHRGREVRRRQRTAVELAVGRQR